MMTTINMPNRNLNRIGNNLDRMGRQWDRFDNANNITSDFNTWANRPGPTRKFNAVSNALNNEINRINNRNNYDGWA